MFSSLYFVGNLRQLVKNIKVSAEVVLVTSCIFTSSTICDPIIYSIRKRELDLKNSIHIANEVIATNNVRIGANLAKEDSCRTMAASQAAQYQHERLSGITRRTRVNFRRGAYHRFKRSMKNLSGQHLFGGRFPIKVLELARRCCINLSLKPHSREQIFYDKLFERVHG